MADHETRHATLTRTANLIEREERRVGHEPLFAQGCKQDHVPLAELKASRFADPDEISWEIDELAVVPPRPHG